MYLNEKEKKRKIKDIVVLVLALIVLVGLAAYFLTIGTEKNTFSSEQDNVKKTLNLVSECYNEKDGFSKEKVDNCISNLESKNKHNSEISNVELYFKIIANVMSSITPTIIVLITYFFMQLKPRDMANGSCKNRIFEFLKFFILNLFILGFGITFYMVLQIYIVDGYFATSIWKDMIVVSTICIGLFGSMLLTFIDERFRGLVRVSLASGGFPWKQKNKILYDLTALKFNLEEQSTNLDKDGKVQIGLETFFSKCNKDGFLNDAVIFIQKQIDILSIVEKKHPKKFSYIENSINQWCNLSNHIQGESPSTLKEISYKIGKLYFKDVFFANSEFTSLKKGKKK